MFLFLIWVSGWYFHFVKIHTTVYLCIFLYVLYFNKYFYRRCILKYIIHQDLLNVIMHFISVVIILYRTKLEIVLVQVRSRCQDMIKLVRILLREMPMWEKLSRELVEARRAVTTMKSAMSEGLKEGWVEVSYTSV